MKYSVLMSVYKNEKVEYFVEALESVINQTLPPEEIVLVRDGQVYEELQNVIDEYLEKYSTLFTYIPLEENGGLGNALKIGLEKCRNEIVARMDTDDICIQNRFELQIKFLEDNTEIDMLGGNIAEFQKSVDDIVDYRIVPQEHKNIIERLKSRSPFNHQTVMFKKSVVLKAGNYQTFYLFEDWFLWIRMYLAGCKFANLNENLCFVRVSGVSARRGGLKYYKSCKKLLKYMRQNKMISLFEYTKIKIVRFIGIVLLPNKLRAWAYKKFLRKRV